MTTKEKTTSLAILAALAGIITLITQCVNEQGATDATPSPTASPNVLVSASPSSSPTSSPSPTPSASATTEVADKKVLMKNEVLSLIIRKPTELTYPSQALVFEIRTVKTLIPSFKGARVGDWEDPLVPVTEVSSLKDYWVDFKPTAPGIYRVLGKQIEISFSDQVYSSPVPFYMELGFNLVSQAHGLADEGTTLAARAALNAKYRALYRSHGIEPIKQAINWIPSDLNQYSSFGASYIQTVVEGAIYPPCLLGPTPDRAPTLSEAQRLMSAAPNGWFYPWDEGEGTLDAPALERIKLIKSYGGKIYTTRQFSDAFAPYVDIFIPVINWFNQPGKVPAISYGGKYGLYTSCMANGNCQNVTDASLVRDRTPFPAMVIETGMTDAKKFVIDSVKAGAKVLLYFHGNLKLPTAWKDGGQYNEGGNGDGTLTYPCPDNQNACPSIRLKMLRDGLQEAARK